jgi:hypothetical protein
MSHPLPPQPTTAARASAHVLARARRLGVAAACALAVLGAALVGPLGAPASADGPVPSCPPIADGVVVCLTPGSVAGQYQLGAVSASATGPLHHVAGHVDLYRFIVADVTTTLPCVLLVADSGATNPCQTAGGTFVSRTATLFDTTAAEPALSSLPLATVTVCNAVLTATVIDIGINSAPAFVLC